MPTRKAKKPARKKAKKKAKKTTTRGRPRKGPRRKPLALRPNSTLTKRLIGDVCRCVRMGNFRGQAFAKFGIPRTRWEHWISDGRRQLRELEAGDRDVDELTPCADLVIRLEYAESEMARGANRNILEAKLEDGRPDIKAIQWFMERRFSREYSKDPARIPEGEQGSGEAPPRGRDVLLGQILRALGRKIEGSDG